MKPKIQLNGWMTIAAMAQARDCSTQYISKLVAQNKLEHTLVPELNNMTLVKAKKGAEA